MLSTTVFPILVYRDSSSLAASIHTTTHLCSVEVKNKLGFIEVTLCKTLVGWDPTVRSVRATLDQ